VRLNGYGIRRGLALVVILAGACTGNGSDDTTTAGPAPTTTGPTTTTASTTLAATTTTNAAPASTTTTIPIADGEPGTLVSAEPMEVDDVDGDVWRVTYVSQRINGNPVEVTGLVVRPRGEAPADGFPVMAWGHATIGVADACIQMNSFDGHLGIPEIQQRLDAGFVVAATDYEGIGGPGTHPYMVGESEAAAVINILRALPEIDGVDAGSDIVLAGHSQGGHAVLSTAQRLAEQAPDLQVVGVAALASVSDPSITVPSMFNNRDLAEFAMMVAVGWADTYPDLELTDVVAPDGLAAAEAARRDKCLNELGPFMEGADLDDLWVTSPARIDAWSAKIDENMIDLEAIDLPVFVAGGGSDPLVPPSLINSLVNRMCQAGLAVDDHRYAGEGHGSTVSASVDDLHAWIADRLAGEPPPTSCPS
jgi:pimeloyl-ACP methyl ester carboxylesterase